MTVFLTSSPCTDAPEGVDLPFVLNESNEFVEQLRERVEPGTPGLLICADPEDFERNDRMAEEFGNAFAYLGMEFSGFPVCDARNEEDAEALIENSRFILLSGGHVPTQNAFFQRIGLREKLEGFDGVIMGISAGSMNCADTVYAQPELEGESVDPDYERYLPGLGLTDRMILPHYQQVKDYELDGRRLYEDITFEDSEGNCFWVLVDGSYVLREEHAEAVYGEAYVIHDGVMEPVCEWGEKKLLDLF